MTTTPIARFLSRRPRVLAPVALVAVATFVVVLSVTGGTATDAAPEPITIQTLGTGLPSDSPGNAIVLLRVTLQPGAAFPSHIHPGALVISVESGDFAFTVIEGEADATRGVASGTPEPTAKLTVGQEVVFTAGDAIFEQEGVVHSARNAGDTPAVVLVAALVDPAQPFLQMVSMDDMDGMATPAA